MARFIASSWRIQVSSAFNQLMTNVNVATTAFYKPRNLAEVMLEFQEFSYGARMDPFVSQLRVETSHLGYKARKSIKRCGKTANRETFQCQEYGNKMISVSEFFKKSTYSLLALHPPSSKCDSQSTISPSNTETACLLSTSVRTGRNLFGSLRKFALSSPINRSAANSPTIIPPQ